MPRFLNHSALFVIRIILISFLLLVSAFALFAQTPSPSPTPAPEATVLKPNQPLERQIKGGETHVFNIQMKTGQTVRTEVLHNNTDLDISLFSPDGKLIVKMETRSKLPWLETITAVSGKVKGNFKVEIKAFGDSNIKGAYRVSLKDLRKTQEKDLKTVEAEKMMSEGLVAIQNKKTLEEAVTKFRQAAQIYKENDEAESEALAVTNLGWAFIDLGKYDEAIKEMSKALSIYLKTGSKLGLAKTNFAIGYSYITTNRYDNAKEYLEKTVTLAEETGDLRLQGKGLSYLGNLYFFQNQFLKSRDYYEKALSPIRKSVNRYEEALAINNIGNTYRRTGQYQKAIEYYELALVIATEIKNKGLKGSLLSGLANAHTNLSQYEKAIEYNDRALVIVREDKNRIGECNVLVNSSIMLTTIGRYQKAILYLRQALEISKEIDYKLVKTVSTAQLGSISLIRANMDDAIMYYEQAYGYAKELKDKYREAEALANLGNLFTQLNDFERAKKYLETSLQLSNEIGEPFQTARVFNMLGQLNRAMSRHQDAATYFNKAFNIYVNIKDRLNQAATLYLIAIQYLDLGQPEKAKTHLNEAMSIQKDVGDIQGEASSRLLLGIIYNNQRDYKKAEDLINQSLNTAIELKSRSLELRSLSSLGSNNYDLKEYNNALGLFERAIKISEDTYDKSNRIDLFNRIGKTYLSLSQPEKAREYVQQAVAIAKEIKFPELESSSLSTLMKIFGRLEKPETAIFYGKQSVNVIQEIRGNIKALDKSLQESFIKSKEDVYRELADLLISQGRFREAQQVLDRLKESEYFEFIRRDAAEIAKLSKRVDLTEKEKAVLESYTKLSDKITQIGQEFGKLETKKQKLGKDESLTPEEQTRYDELSKQLTDANEAFRIFLEKDLVAQLSVEAAKGIELDKGLQADLKKWETGTVSVYTVLATDRYRAVVTTPYTQTDGKTEIKPAELNKKIFQFRAALTNPASDPKRLGKELYDILIKPIEKDLSGAKTILWSLDGPLRYVPVSALWDGKQYLVEKYRNIVLTPSTRKNITQQNTQDWSALAGGVSTEQEIQLSEGEEKIKFSPLPKVIRELREIVIDEKATEQKAVAVGSRQIRTKTTNTTGGIFSGKVLLDEEFNEKNLTGEIRREIAAGKRQYNLLHVASHFRLGSSMANSFLLTGDGKYITLEQIKRSEGFDLKGMELVTLSACNTGFDGGTGAEVDSLATLLESRGAKASLSSLWEVPDESTYALMIEFYRIKKMNPKLSKAEALRQSQLKLLKGTGKTPAKFAHPFYWSPFVMVGNWR